MLQRKKPLIFISIILILFAGSIVYLFFKIKALKSAPVPKEKTMEEILETLTAPEGNEPLSAEERKTLETLTAPKKKTPPVSDDVLKSLTAPQR